jgi:fructose 1,6-bisphosphatase
VKVVVAFTIDAVNTLFNANDAVVANEADTADPVATVKLNVEPSPFVNVNMLALTLPVTIKLPVFTVTAEPVATTTLNVELSPLVKVIVLLVALAVTSKDAVLTVTPAFNA